MDTTGEQSLSSKMINYAYNNVGALASVGTNLLGSDPNLPTNLLNRLTFRAWGSLNSLHYGNERRQHLRISYKAVAY